MMQDLPLSVTDFVAVCNQTLEYAYPVVMIVGELANFRVSKNKWVYFDLKDDMSSVRFFGSVYALPGPLEDGMMVQVRGAPRLHHLYGFSVTAQTIQPVGEGAIKHAADLLKDKLTKEGLFDTERKRPLPMYPSTVGLIASGESAAYHDFIKVLNARWGGVHIRHYDVQVQGEAAPQQVVAALEYFNTNDLPDVIVVTRGGGSADDLAAFSHESVVRAVAASRVPTMVAVGHEIDTSLAELAADVRASTPSNAAEMLVSTRAVEQAALDAQRERLKQGVVTTYTRERQYIKGAKETLHRSVALLLERTRNSLGSATSMLEALSPHSTLRRGYAIAYAADGTVITSSGVLKPGDTARLSFHDGDVAVSVERTV